MKKSLFIILTVLALLVSVSCSQEAGLKGAATGKAPARYASVFVNDGLIYVQFAEDQKIVSTTPNQFWTSVVDVTAGGASVELNSSIPYILGPDGLPMYKDPGDSVYYVENAYLTLGNVSSVSKIQSNANELATSYKLYSFGSKRNFLALPYDAQNTNRETEYRLQLAQLADLYDDSDLLFKLVVNGEIPMTVYYTVGVTDTSSVKANYTYVPAANYDPVTNPVYDVKLTFSVEANGTFFVQPTAGSTVITQDLRFTDGKSYTLTAEEFNSIVDPTTNTMTVYGIEDGKLYGITQVEPVYAGPALSFVPMEIEASFTQDTAQRLVINKSTALSKTAKYSIEAEPSLNGIDGYVITLSDVFLRVSEDPYQNPPLQKAAGKGYAIMPTDSLPDYVSSVLYTISIFDRNTHSWIYYEYFNNADINFAVDMLDPFRYEKDFILDQYVIQDILTMQGTGTTVFPVSWDLIRLTVTAEMNVTGTAPQTSIQDIYFIIQ